LAKLQQASEARNFDGAEDEIDRIVVDAIDMLAKGVAISEALDALQAREPLGAIVEGLYMSAKSETGTVGLEAVGNWTLKVFHL
jgi:hypothetical protein